MPALVTSTDDTTVFVFKGRSSAPENWYLLQGGGIQKKDKYQSYYTNEEKGTDHLNGLQVRPTITINGIGMIAPTFITIKGVNERELPIESCPSGRLYIKIPGLCVGGTQDLRHEAIGHVCFIRNQKNDDDVSNEQLNFEYY